MAKYSLMQSVSFRNRLARCFTPDLGWVLLTANSLHSKIRAIYVEPKWASMLDGSGVRELLGTKGAVYHAPALHPEEPKITKADVLA